MIKIKGLRKRFGDRVVLDGLDLNVAHGEVVAILGPSGSGKSTLLRCLNLLERFESGTVAVGEATVSAGRYSRKDAYILRRQTAMVFQNYNLFDNKTAAENVMYAPLCRRMWPKERAKAQAMELLERVGLKDQAFQYPATLSGGQKQRVSIARALAVQPQAILFDEPTSGLDPELVHEVLRLILQLAQEKITMVIVTHEIEFARQVADRIIFLEQGAILRQGVASEILSRSGHPRLQRFLERVGQ